MAGLTYVGDHITMTIGGGTYNAAGIDSKETAPEGYAYYITGNNNPSITNKVPTDGCYFKFVTNVNGLLNVAVKINKDKPTYVVEGSENISFYLDGEKRNAGHKPGAITLGMISFPVIAGTNYYVYCSGSKIGCFGFEFIQGHVLETADADFYGLYLTSEVALPENVEAYTGILNVAEDELALTKVAGTVIPAATPVLVKANAAGLYNFAPSNTGAETIVSSLKGVAAATTVASIESANTGKTCLTLGVDGEGVVAFRKPAGTSIAANKVYLLVNTPSTPAPAIRIVMNENGATDIKSIEDSEKAVKFIEYGKLYIQKDGVVYDATGAKVK